jgi:hypothetical protein
MVDTSPHPPCRRQDQVALVIDAGGGIGVEHHQRHVRIHFEGGDLCQNVQSQEKDRRSGPSGHSGILEARLR